MTSQADFDQRYSVVAHFEGEYRRVLEISLVQTGSLAPVDAVVVMMNPGSSRPKPGFEQGQGLVPAMPDPTQYQVMRLMDKREWRRVRVLNLSDLQNPNSACFRDQILKRGADLSHSIFSSDRRGELETRLERAPGAPVIVAWGCDDGLESLAISALGALEKEWIVGRPSARGKWRYWHPLLRNARLQRQWVEDISSQLDFGRPAIS